MNVVIKWIEFGQNGKAINQERMIQMRDLESAIRLLSKNGAHHEVTVSTACQQSYAAPRLMSAA